MIATIEESLFKMEYEDTIDRPICSIDCVHVFGDNQVSIT